MTAKTHNGGYKTRPQAKNRHLSRIDNSSADWGLGKKGWGVGYRKVLRGKIRLGSQETDLEGRLLAPFYERWAQF